MVPLTPNDGATGPVFSDHTAEAMELVEDLAGSIGPRRPTSAAERAAAELMAARLRATGLDARLETFAGYASFGYPFGIILASAIAPGLLSPRRRSLRSGLALLAAAGLIAEGSLTRTPLSDALARRESQNLVATLEPTGRTERTLCLMSHMDTSRSGLIFHPALVRFLGRWITMNSLLTLALAAGEVAGGGSAAARRPLAAARAILATGLGLLVEREVLGRDVPGANDNASGSAVALTLMSRAAASPPASTRLVLVITGCEESGTLGSQAFLDSHDTSGWMFLNFDNVGGGGTLRYLRREGVIRRWDADEGLVRAAAGVARRCPELRMDAEDHPAGLTYDTSPVQARGGRALTFSIQDGSIPNLHRMTDTVANIDPGGVGRTFAAGGEMIAAIDRGEAD